MSEAKTVGERTQLSKVLITFAWLIEVFAVITGLAISLMIGVDTYNKNLLIPGQSQAVTNISNTVIAALPFVMVSIVELAKIPASQAVPRASPYPGCSSPDTRENRHSVSGFPVSSAGSRNCRTGPVPACRTGPQIHSHARKTMD